jgi:signal transduction histidine kinase
LIRAILLKQYYLLMMNHENSVYSGPMPLVRWIWRSYFRASLMPLLVVEVALISLYFISNEITNRENIQAIRMVAEQDVTNTAFREAVGINRQLEGIAQATEFLRQHTAIVMTGAKPFELDDPDRFAYSKDGAFYTTKDTGSAAVFYSGHVPIGDTERKKAYRSAGLDDAYIGIKNAFPLIVQLYYNTHDSLNRIYPYFEVLSQYPSRMNIPSYNFYYEADARHNPQRKVVWTDVYVDPAGQGWMTSCIAPVYSGDFLEGVVGLDITVDAIIADVLDLKVPWNGYGLLVSRNGTIIALPKAGESDWGVKEFTKHEYSEAIHKDTFKPASFNVYERDKNSALSKGLREKSNGTVHTDLNGKRIVSWATIPQTGWKLLITVPESEVYATSTALAGRLNNLAWLMLAGMLVFYIIFFSFLYRRARQMTEFISKPLEAIDRMVTSVAAGNYQQNTPDFFVAELNRTAEGIVQMGGQIDAAGKSRKIAEAALVELSSRLQSIFDLSPDGFISIDANAMVIMVNPAFCRITETASADWLGISEDELWQRIESLTHAPLNVLKAQNNFKLELLRPTWRVLQCVIRDISLDNVFNAGKVIYMYDITREVELDRMKSQFLATAAHELRTPLTTVMGYSELLANDMVPANKKSMAVNAILDQSRWLVNIINELLDLARIEAGGIMDFNIQAYAADQLVIDAVNVFAVPAGRGEVRCELVAGLYVGVDKDKFKAVIFNLLDNAYKYSFNGDVVIRVLEKTSDNIPYVGFQVEDAGIGMTEAQVAHVFERFWRADASGNIPGTGLGMSISNEIIRLMGGAIEIASQKDTGTRMTVWLTKTSSRPEVGTH